ncbi:MAG TPA: hypothetical protein VFF58_00370 [Candidatus Nitrosotalea sp.]|nr:hypothetical protein [Candidatus Nitrosotalea sp.]
MLKSPDHIGAGVKSTLAFLTLLLPASVIAANPIQADMDTVLRADPRNKGITVSVSDRGGRSTLTYDLTSVAPTNSMVDVFRVFLQFASAEKDREFKSVQLSFRGNPKFLISGQYFKQLGEEFGAQNPVYTIRTFPGNLMRLDGSRAYPSWAGGLIGVLGKQMEDANDFHRQWWLDDLASAVGRPILQTTSSTSSLEATQRSSEPRSQASSLPLGQGSPKPGQYDSGTAPTPSSVPSSVRMQFPVWLAVFPQSRDQINASAIGAATVSYTAPASSDSVINFYRETLTKRGAAIHVAFNGVGTTIEGSLDNESCVIRVTDIDAGTTNVRAQCANGQIDPTSIAPPPAPPPHLPPGVHRVEYAIRGSARAVGLTYRNATGGSEQNDTRLPAALSFYAASGQFVYLSAQNKTNSGDVHVSITVDGRLLQEATSSTAYGIASASGSVPR